MSEAIDFYFDFSSPYGYLASHLVDEVAARHAREVRWLPYLMGVAMKQTGSRPLTERGPIGVYAMHDFERSARAIGVPYQLPAHFPISGVAPSRAYYWRASQDAEGARALARALYAALFAEGLNIGDPSVVVEVAAASGLNADEVSAGLQDQAVKDRLRAVTEEAIARGVFGSPFFIVDGEAFWGHDRLEQVERWLETGGW